MNRSLAGGISRAFMSHKSANGYQYHRAMQLHLRNLPKAALVTLREAGRLAVELEASGRELELASGHGIERSGRWRFPFEHQQYRIDRRFGTKRRLPGQ